MLKNPRFLGVYIDIALEFSIETISKMQRRLLSVTDRLQAANANNREADDCLA